MKFQIDFHGVPHYPVDNQMQMSTLELYDAVSAWLLGQGYESTRDEKETGKFFWLDTPIGKARCRIMAESSKHPPPPTLHFFARFPLEVQKCHFPIISLVLMNWNCGLRFGNFILSASENLVSYRVTQAISTDQPLDHQFDFLMKQLIWAVEVYAPILQGHLERPPDWEEEIMRWPNFKKEFPNLFMRED